MYNFHILSSHILNGAENDDWCKIRQILMQMLKVNPDTTSMSEIKFYSIDVEISVIFCLSLIYSSLKHKRDWS
jgi:hypothetical protein